MTDEQLATWLHDVNLMPGSTRQAAIGNAAKGIATKATVGNLAGYVLLAFGLPDSKAFSTIRAAVVEHDSTFGCAIDDLETKLAAAICVAEIMERTSLTAVVVSSLVMSADWLGLKTPISELPTRAIETQYRLAGSIRDRRVISTKVDIAPILSRLVPLPEDASPTLHQELSTLIPVVSDGLTTVTDLLKTLATQLSTRLNATDEELDILWWALSAHSERLDLPWGEVSDDGIAALFLAVEFSNLVVFPTEPQATEALLARLLGTRASHQLTIDQAITTAGGQGLQNPIEDWSDPIAFAFLPQ